MAYYQSTYSGQEIDKAVHFVHNRIAEPFRVTRTYVVGEFVSHDGLLYQCIDDVTEAGAWTADNWEVQKIFDNEGYVILDCNQDYGLILEDLTGTTWEFINLVSNFPYLLPTLPDTTVFNHTNVTIRSNNTDFVGLNFDSGSSTTYSALNLLTNSGKLEVMRSSQDTWDGESEIELNQFTEESYKRIKFISGDSSVLKDPVLISWLEQNAAQITD